MYEQNLKELAETDFIECEQIEYMAEQRREWRGQEFVVSIIPAGLNCGKTITPRARAHLPAGFRDRFGREES